MLLPGGGIIKVLKMSTHTSITPFVCYRTCECENEPTLMLTGTSGARGKGYETINFGGQQVKGQGHTRKKYIWRPGGAEASVSTPPLELSSFSIVSSQKVTRNLGLIVLINQYENGINVSISSLSTPSPKIWGAFPTFQRGTGPLKCWPHARTALKMVLLLGLPSVPCKMSAMISAPKNNAHGFVFHFHSSKQEH